MTQDDKDDEIAAVGYFFNKAMRAFEREEYGEKRMFFPDNATVRQAKFLHALFEKYGIKEQILDEADKMLTFEMLTKG